METNEYFKYIFEDVDYGRNLILVLAVLKPELLQEAGFKADEIQELLKIAEEKILRQKKLMDLGISN